MASPKKPKKSVAPKRPPAPIYGGNPKHQEPWQRGKKGSLCTKETMETAQGLLDASVEDGKRRFATDGERAFEGKEHAPNEWHGFPVGWKEVPETLRHRWQDEGRVRRAHIQKYWDDHTGQR